MTTPYELFAAHRARITAHLLASAPRDGRLALLGAGHCNDVDLAEVAARFDEILLVDRNAEAIARARARQPPGVQRRIRLHGEIDLSGWADRLPVWREAPPDEATLEGFVADVPERLAARLPPCEVVASTCLLSQLSWAVGDAIGTDHPAAPRIRRALLRLHLRTLLALTRPGGVALLVNDVAVAPRGALEAQLLARGPRGAIEDRAAAGDLFRGAPPAALEEALAADPVLRARCASAEALEPWLWTRTAELTYLIHALRMRRALQSTFAIS